MGGLAYLYMFSEPYILRMKKMFLVGITLTLCVALGMLSRPYPVLVVLIVAFIGSSISFVFGTLKVAGPGPIFFVWHLVCSLG